MKETFIHPTALIYPNVTIGEGCYIGPYCVIGAPPEHGSIDPFEECGVGVFIGDGSRLYGHVTVDSGIEQTTFIGENCILMKHSHVGHDAIVRHDSTIACGAKIGGHSKVEPYCNIGLNAVLHQFAKIPEGTMVGASAFVKGEWTEPWMILIGVPAGGLGRNKVGMAKWGK